MISLVTAKECIEHAARNAAADYERWSGGEWLSDAGVESVIQVKIAEALYESESGFITLETSAENAVSWDNRFKFAEDIYLGPKSRFDICIWSKQHELSGVIEVKRSNADWDIRKDIGRMAEFFSKYGRRSKSFRYVIVAAYLWSATAKNHKNLKDKVTSIFRDVTEQNGSVSGDCEFFDLKTNQDEEYRQSLAIIHFE